MFSIIRKNFGVITITIVLIAVVGVAIYAIVQQNQQLPGTDSNLPFLSAPVDVNGVGVQPNQADQEAFKPFVVPTSIKILLDSNDSIKIGSQTVTFQGSWKVVDAIHSVGGTDWECVDTTGDHKLCDVYSISDGTDTFYITTPHQATKQFTGDVKYESKELPTGVGAKTFSISHANVVIVSTDPNATAPDIIIQENGCLTDNICAASGLFNTDQSANSSQVSNFQNFINSILINS